MKKLYIKICIFLIGGIAATGCSRYYYEKAGKLHNNMAYSKAVVYYEKVAKSKKYPAATKMLAECYGRMNNKQKQEYWYRHVIRSPLSEDSDKLYFSQILINNGKYIEAKYWLNKYLRKMPDDSLARVLLSAIDSMHTYFADSASYVVKLLDINSPEASSFGATYYKDGIVFSSEMQNGRSFKKCDWTGRPFLDLFYAKIAADGSLGKPEKLNGKINKDYHEGPSAFNNKGNEVYFTSGAYTKRNKPEDNAEGVNLLRIYKASKVNNQWNNIREVPLITDDRFSTGHPALSPDDKRLYFVSDMEGGFGGTDIYVSELHNGKLGTPRNLGPLVNSPKNEMFPFIAEDGTLYFSSNGFGGLGGMDVFSSIYENGRWGKPVNLGFPINSFGDDISFIIGKGNKTGFFSSDRESGEGIDNLYSFNKPDPVFVVNGEVVDRETKMPLGSVPIDILKEMQPFQMIHTDSSGRFTFSLEKNADYSLVVRNQFSLDETELTTKNKKNSETFFVTLELSVPVFTLKGLVVDRAQKPLRGARVELVAFYENDANEILTDENGNFSFPLTPEKSYMIYGSMKNYLTLSTFASTLGKKNSEELFVRLELEEIVINKPIRVDNIHYDYNKWSIREDARPELEKLVKMMQDNQAVQIELSSHCDSRGSDLHNMKLSQRRAESAVQYIVSRGIDIRRIIARGYGETRLLNKCSNNVNCSEEDHQFNRRTEFKVIGIDQKLLTENARVNEP